MRLFRFEALGLLPKTREVFDGLQWNGGTYSPVQLDLQRVHKAVDSASEIQLFMAMLGYNKLMIRVQPVKGNPVYLFTDQRRAEPLWRKFQTMASATER